MAKPQGFMNNYSPIREQEREDELDLDGCEVEETNWASGCCFWRLFCFDGEGGGAALLQQRRENRRQSWVEKKVKEAKEASEQLAGPKWKNFIRKITKHFNNKQPKTTQFQYDPQSYALNFDNGNGNGTGTGNDGEEQVLLPGFSSRFATTFSGEERRSLAC